MACTHIQKVHRGNEDPPVERHCGCAFPSSPCRRNSSRPRRQHSLPFRSEGQCKGPWLARRAGLASGKDRRSGLAGVCCGWCCSRLSLSLPSLATRVLLSYCETGPQRAQTSQIVPTDQQTGSSRSTSASASRLGSPSPLASTLRATDCATGPASHTDIGVRQPGERALLWPLCSCTAPTRATTSGGTLAHARHTHTVACDCALEAC